MTPQSSSLRTLVCITLASLGCASLSATTIVDTDFSNGTTQGWRADYAASSNPTLSVLNDPDHGNYLQVHGNIAFRGAYITFPEKVTLGVGDTLSISFDYRNTGGADIAQGLRFGFFSFGEGDTPSNSSDNGYFVSAPLGVDGTVRLSRDFNGNTNDPASGSDGTLLAQSESNANLALNNWYTISFILERTNESSILLTATVDNVVLSYTIDSGILIDEFGMFYIGSGNTNPRFSLTNVKVDYTQIPEAGTVWFGLSALAALAAARVFTRRAK